MVLDDKGIIAQAQTAKERNEEKSDMEIITLAYAGEKTEELKPNGTAITAENLETQLKKTYGENVDVTESGDTFKVTITEGEEKKVYEIASNGEVTKGSAVETFEFTIDGDTYLAEEGMTWEEWIFSDYNTRWDNTKYISSFNYLLVDGDDVYLLGCDCPLSCIIGCRGEGIVPTDTIREWGICDGVFNDNIIHDKIYTLEFYSFRCNELHEQYLESGHDITTITKN